MAAFGKSFSFSGGAAAGTSGQTGTSGSLFGSANQPSTSNTNAFGSSFEKRQRAGTATEAPSTFPSISNSTFGQSGAAGTSGSGLFGNTQASTGGVGTGGFGSLQTSTGGTGTGFFGSTNAPAAGTTGFGSTSLATTQPAQSGSLFGTTTGGIFGSQQQQQQPAQPQPPTQQMQQPNEVDELSKQLLLIKECWDPASPNYQFRHYFYNVVEPGQTHLYQCPPGQDPVLWQQAVSDNPDPTTLVPVLANGFDDLRKRVDSQSLQMQSYRERTAEISEKLGKILQKHHSETMVRLSECRRHQSDLSQRLLEFIKLLQLLRLRGQLLHPEEEMFRVRVEQMEKELTHSGAFKQRLAEIQNHVYQLQANARRHNGLMGRSGGPAGDGYEVTNESQLDAVVRVLEDKQRGLAQMTQIISKDATSIDEIEQAIEDKYLEAQKQKEAREHAQIAKSFAQPW
ncbi:Nucleoporin nup57 [Coemansia brasiliensis]|uniref:Nucleoporin nup57 n=1 Tax=Coemansia brasiliensis TaxID=2650707 RepID=A0A9W8I6C5_9FUNG|nr:Nucleoporin nup57 [Coemansia brasiliensis]